MRLVKADAVKSVAGNPKTEESTEEMVGLLQEESSGLKNTGERQKRINPKPITQTQNGASRDEREPETPGKSSFSNHVRIPATPKAGSFSDHVGLSVTPIGKSPAAKKSIESASKKTLPRQKENRQDVDSEPGEGGRWVERRVLCAFVSCRKA